MSFNWNWWNINHMNLKAKTHFPSEVYIPASKLYFHTIYISNDIAARQLAGWESIAMPNRMIWL